MIVILSITNTKNQELELVLKSYDECLDLIKTLNYTGEILSYKISSEEYLIATGK